MGVDRVNSRIYTPVRPTSGKKLDVDAMLPAEEVPQSKDEEAQEKRYKRKKKPAENNTTRTPGQRGIDEHI